MLARIALGTVLLLLFLGPPVAACTHASNRGSFGAPLVAPLVCNADQTSGGVTVEC